MALSFAKLNEQNERYCASDTMLVPVGLVFIKIRLYPLRESTKLCTSLWQRWEQSEELTSYDEIFPFGEILVTIDLKDELMLDDGCPEYIRHIYSVLKRNFTSYKPSVVRAIMLSILTYDLGCLPFFLQYLTPASRILWDGMKGKEMCWQITDKIFETEYIKTLSSEFVNTRFESAFGAGYNFPKDIWANKFVKRNKSNYYIYFSNQFKPRVL